MANAVIRKRYSTYLFLFTIITISYNKISYPITSSIKLDKTYNNLLTGRRLGRRHKSKQSKSHSGTASQEQVREIVRAADWYLCHPARGGYCLNTDFGEVKLDMGRMFGFAYGSKENGAVFSHMAVMYAYAL